MNFDQDPDAQKLAIEKALNSELLEVDLRFRSMFGGIMAYAYGKPFASLSNAGLALKLSKKDSSALLDVKGARPLRYKADDPPSKTYTLVPNSWIGNEEDLLPYIKKSISYVRSLSR